MALHAVLFTEAYRYDGNTKIHIGRALVDEYYDTSEFKKLKPGENVPVERFGRQTGGYEVEAPTPFVAELKLNNSLYFSSNTTGLHDEVTNTFYPMFLSDLVDMAKRGIIEKGVVKGKFGFVKRNKNFGIEFLENI